MPAPECTQVSLYTLTSLVQIILCLGLTSFIVFTALSFFKVRLKKKEAQFQNLIHALNVKEEEARVFTPPVRDEYTPADYKLPVIFSALISLMGFVALFFGAELICMNEGKPNLLLTGIHRTADLEMMQDERWKSLIAITFAFAGAFVWSAQNIIRRLVTGDLSPSSYYSAGLRIIFACLVALILAFFLETLPGEGYTKNLLPVLAFLTGILPEQAFLYLKDNLTIFSNSRTRQASVLPLSMIEGINAFHKIRLTEIGIDNAQNLSEANLLELLLKTPFSPGKLIDWIAQAKLFVYFNIEIEKLRKIGIRTIFDFRRACAMDDQLPKIAHAAGMSELMLSLVYQLTKDDAGITKLFEYQTILGTMGKGQKSNSSPQAPEDIPLILHQDDVHQNHGLRKRALLKTNMVYLLGRRDRYKGGILQWLP